MLCYSILLLATESVKNMKTVVCMYIEFTHADLEDTKTIVWLVELLLNKLDFIEVRMEVSFNHSTIKCYWLKNFREKDIELHVYDVHKKALWTPPTEWLYDNYNFAHRGQLEPDW